MAAAVVVGGEPAWIGTQGVRRAGGAEPVSADTAFWWFSMTKIATATAVMRLVESGAVALDAPARDNLAEVAGLDPRITVRQLLNHSSGLANPMPMRWIPAAAVEDRTTELAALATDTGLDITVCHLPPGTSKWNKIEHRLFSAISRNWRGRPLESHEVVIETLRATTTSTGLTVHAELDTGTYERGIKITDKQIAALEATQLHRHEFHGDWNYTLTADRTATRPKEPT